MAYELFQKLKSDQKVAFGSVELSVGVAGAKAISKQTEKILWYWSLPSIWFKHSMTYFVTACWTQTLKMPVKFDRLTYFSVYYSPLFDKTMWPQ